MTPPCGAAAALALLLLPAEHTPPADPAAPQNHVTILYDAFGKPSRMKKDWGYSAFIEHGSKRTLFDTGNDPELFAHNVAAAGVDLRRLDFVVISHRHLDHTAGLTHLLRGNPTVKIYAPKEAFGVFGSAPPSRFYRTQGSRRSTG